MKCWHWSCPNQYCSYSLDEKGLCKHHSIPLVKTFGYKRQGKYWLDEVTPFNPGAKRLGKLI